MWEADLRNEWCPGRDWVFLNYDGRQRQRWKTSYFLPLDINIPAISPIFPRHQAIKHERITMRLGIDRGKEIVLTFLWFLQTFSVRCLSVHVVVCVPALGCAVCDVRPCAACCLDSFSLCFTCYLNIPRFSHLRKQDYGVIPVWDVVNSVVLSFRKPLPDPRGCSAVQFVFENA